jgi:hypothetical protein
VTDRIRRPRGRTEIGRRRFLRGAGGAAVALPLLLSLAPSSRAQSAGKPKRIIIFHYPEGTLLDDDVSGGTAMADLWTPGAAGPLSTASLSPILAPLADPLPSGGSVADKCLVVSGLDNTASEGGHTGSGRSLLTAVPVIDPEGSGIAGGPSLDFVLAQHQKTELNLPFSSLNLSTVFEFGGENQLFWDDQQNPIPQRANPKSTFDSLFGAGLGETDPAEPSTLQRLRAERKSVLDGVLGSLSDLDKRLGHEDRQVLAAHADKIRELEKQLTASGTAVHAECGIPVLADEDWDGDFFYREDISAKAQIDLLVMALACDLTRVGSFTFSNYDNPTFPWLASEGATLPIDGKGWHSVIHENRFDDFSRDVMMIGFRWYNRMLAYLVAELDRFVEPDGTTLLDNTLVLCLSEFGNGGSHQPNRLPVILAGGLGGAFTVGRHLSVSGSTGSLFSTIQGFFGIEGTWASGLGASYAPLSLG